MNRLIPAVLLFFLGTQVLSQSTNIPLNEDYYHWISRYETKSGFIFPQLFTGVTPFKRANVVAFIDSVEVAGLITSDADRFNLQYLKNDSWEWSRTETADSDRSVARLFYRKKSDFYHVDIPDFDLHINPVIYFGAGTDSRIDDRLFINTRGVEIRGTIDGKIGFYTYLTDNQAILPGYVEDYVNRNNVIPHEGFWKTFKDSGVDFLQARAHLSFNLTKHIDFQFGHDSFFIGNGYRSLIRSGFSPPSMFIKTNARIWKINYMFLLNRMVADVQGTNGLTGSDQYPEKFSALHHFSINLGKKVNLGFFEAVVFSPRDTVNYNSFEWSYLNPIIFYRAVEQQFGSSDNVLLGADFKWLVAKGVSLYGQFVLDEFVLEHIKAGDGWWANKFAIQGGLKYVDAFSVSNLDLQGEVNIVRPFTYSHGAGYGSYSSYRQSLAHPLGANFSEVIGIVRYQPLPRLNTVAKLILVKTGRDGTGENWGGDILKSNSTREQEFGNTIGQGISNDILFASLTASWHLRHNIFVDANLVYRRSESPASFYNHTSTISSLALRWNIARRLYEF